MAAFRNVASVVDRIPILARERGDPGDFLCPRQRTCSTGSPFLGALLLAGILSVVAGCAADSVVLAHDPEAPPGPCDILIRLGHGRSPDKDRLVQMDGSAQPAWSTSPEESSVTALDLYVKGADRRMLRSDDFKEVRRFRAGNTEKIVLERDRVKDFASRMIRVQLFRHGDIWIPEVILICQETLPQQRK